MKQSRRAPRPAPKVKKEVSPITVIKNKKKHKHVISPMVTLYTNLMARLNELNSEIEATPKTVASQSYRIELKSRRNEVAKITLEVREMVLYELNFKQV